MRTRAHHISKAVWLFSLAMLWSGVAWAQVSDTLRFRLHTDTSLVTQFYQQRAFEPAWTHEGGPTTQAYGLSEVLSSSFEDGLNPEEYQAHQIISYLQSFDRPGPFSPSIRADLELLLTKAFFTWASDMDQGMVDPASISLIWGTHDHDPDLVERLILGLEAGRIEAVMKLLRPRFEGYLRLKEALASYRQLAEEGGWPLVQEGKKLEPGMQDSRVKALRARLRITDPVPEPHPDSLEVYDSSLAGAVRAFQKRHGLAEDGIVGRAVLAALKVSVEERVEQIRLNLERWRWLPDTLGRNHIRVNVPGYALEVIEGRERVLSMRVIVGSRSNKTPLFSSQVEKVVLAPRWYVPRSIIEGEILPKQIADSTYLVVTEKGHKPLF